MGDLGHGWFGFGGIFMILFWGLFILGIVALVKWLASTPGEPGPAPPRHKTALELLEERYARGEIDREEYLQKRRDLEG